MKAGIRPGFPRLSATEGLLLAASTRSGPMADQAWKRWRLHCEIEAAGPESQSLFGMLYAKRTGNPEDADSITLKGVYKRTWYANQLALAQLKPLHDRLAFHGIPAILMNDASLAAVYYPDIGYRAIRCIDILAPGKHWEAAISLATGQGWLAEQGQSFASPASLSIAAFSGAGNRSLRVWANLFTAEPQDDTEARIWEQARSVHINGTPILTLGPVEQLLCLSADAFRGKAPPLSLYADGKLLLESLNSAAEWPRLVWQAQRYEHILPLRNLLAFLQTALSVELPSWVLPALHKMAISHAELRQYHLACESLPLRLKSACLRWIGPLLPGAAGG